MSFRVSRLVVELPAWVAGAGAGVALIAGRQALSTERARASRAPSVASSPSSGHSMLGLAVVRHGTDEVRACDSACLFARAWFVG